MARIEPIAGKGLFASRLYALVLEDDADKKAAAALSYDKLSPQKNKGYMETVVKEINDKAASFR